MLVCIFGESCTGKTTLAQTLSMETGAEVISGRDYLRLAKNPGEAERLFAARLADCVTGADKLIYVTTEAEQLRLLPPGAVRVLMTADLDVIQERFAQRMGGKLPPPVAAMLEKKHGQLDGLPHTLRFHNGQQTVEQATVQILALCRP